MFDCPATPLGTHRQVCNYCTNCAAGACNLLDANRLPSKASSSPVSFVTNLLLGGKTRRISTYVLLPDGVNGSQRQKSLPYWVGFFSYEEPL